MKIKAEGLVDLKRYIRQSGDRFLRAYLDELDRIGMKVVTAIRTGEASFWNDHTGALRSSIGYVIMCDGRRYSENFEVVNGRGAEGKQNAMTFAAELAANYPKGIVLVIVAGMEYAEYVEKIKSRTVLEDGKFLANELVKKQSEKFEARYGK